MRSALLALTAAGSLGLAAPAFAQSRQAPEEMIHLVAVAGPDVHARGAATSVGDETVQVWWWHFWAASPEEDWNTAAYLIEIDCTTRTRRRLRTEFYQDMRISYIQAGDGVRSEPATPDSAGGNLVRGACEDWRDGEPFASPSDAFEVAQNYFNAREQDGR